MSFDSKQSLYTFSGSSFTYMCAMMFSFSTTPYSYMFPFLITLCVLTLWLDVRVTQNCYKRLIHSNTFCPAHHRFVFTIVSAISFNIVLLVSYFNSTLGFSGEGPYTLRKRSRKTSFATCARQKKKKKTLLVHPRKRSRPTLSTQQLNDLLRWHEHGRVLSNFPSSIPEDFKDVISRDMFFMQDEQRRAQ